MFEWSKVYKKLHLNARANAADWRKVIGERIDLKLLALAHLASGIDDWLDLNKVKQLVQRLQFPYNFTPRREELKKQLAGNWGIELLQSQNGDYQYLRTIRRLSGRMYVRFARKIGQGIQRYSWNKMTQYECVKNELQGALEQYFGNNDEDTMSREDVINFFCELSKLYLRYNKAFDVSDIQELAPLTEAVSRNIIEEMCKGDDDTEIDMDKLDVLPFIVLDNNGRALFQLPHECVNHQNIAKIFFKFYTTSDASNEAFARAKYDASSGWCVIWQNEFENGVPLDEIQSIRREITYDNNDFKQDDALPLICRDANVGYLLVDVDESQTNESMKIVKRGALSQGGVYQIVSLDGQMHKTCCCIGDERNELSINEIGRFCVPNNCDLIVIDENEYSVSSDIDRWIDREARCKRVKMPGGRYYVEKSSDFMRGGVEYQYEYNGTNTLLEDDIVPDNVLWKWGYLRGLLDGREVFHKAVTFIEDLNIEELQEPLDYGEKTSREITIGEKTINVEIGDIDCKVEFSHPSHSEVVFRVPITRSGVYFESGKELIPIPKEVSGGFNNVREIAEKDFEKLRFTVQRENQRDAVLLIRGNAFIRGNGQSSFGNLPDYWRRQPHDGGYDSDSSYFSVRIGDVYGKNYKFHIYKPLETVICDGGNTVQYKRIDDDLQIRYYLSFYEKERQKKLLVLPAHRQDHRPFILIADNVEHITDDNGRCVETVTIKSFFSNKDIDWGHGVLCFMAYQSMSGMRERYEIVSSGFFIPPEERRNDINDDEYGLRIAIADKNIDKIKEVLMSEDEKTRSFVSNYIKNLSVNNT